MPNEHDGDDDYRVVLDEQCLDWRLLSPDALSHTLDALADLLEPIADGRTTALMDLAYEVECLPSLKLAEALYSSRGGLPPDERRRLQVLLDKCRVLEPETADLPPQTRRNDGAWHESSWGMAHALARGAEGRSMSCLVGPSSTSPDHCAGWPSGWLAVERDTGSLRHQVDVHLLRAPDDLVSFWRAIFTREQVTPDRFFTLTESAFPRLLFASSLKFHHFRGKYTEILPWLVHLLGLLNDHFAEVLSSCGGDQKKVRDHFKALGADISPESPNTKKNAKAWEQRTVLFQEERHRCEWHGKRLWDRDRVHFSLPLQAHDGRVLIGIFTDHLDT